MALLTANPIYKQYQRDGITNTQESPASGGPITAKLLSAANYAILAAAGITNTGATVVTNGVIGSYPTTSITFDGGTATVDNVHAAQAQTDALAAYTYYSGLTFVSLGTDVDMSTSGNGATPATYLPGNYSSTSSLDIPTSITLDAQGDPSALFVFMSTASTVTLESGASVILANGALAANVIWIVGSSFTQVASGAMVGNILANTSITFGGGTFNGRALAGIIAPSGAVTIASAETTFAVPAGGRSGIEGYDSGLITTIPEPGTGYPTGKSITETVGTYPKLTDGTIQQASLLTVTPDLSTNPGSNDLQNALESTAGNNLVPVPPLGSKPADGLSQAPEHE
jgi:hypothetical protein